MTEQDVKALVVKYGTSWYADVDRIDPSRVAPQGGPEQALRDLDEPGSLLAAMEENVDEATHNRDGVRARYERAAQDGLFDNEAFAASNKKARGPWARAMKVQRGDRDRAIGELLHWREYREWARSKERAA